MKRPYDDHIPAPELKAIQGRRFSPTGVMQKISKVSRGGIAVWSYPWNKLELGDFFIAPIEERSETAMRVAFHQMAAKRDWEISLAKITVGQGEPALRVTLTIINVTRYKHLAEKAGCKMRWPKDDRRNKYKAKNQKRSERRRNAKKPSPPKPRIDNPFWADEPEDFSPPPVFAPEVKLSREEALRRALSGED